VLVRVSILSGLNWTRLPAMRFAAKIAALMRGSVELMTRPARPGQRLSTAGWYSVRSRLLSSYAVYIGTTNHDYLLRRNAPQMFRERIDWNTDAYDSVVAAWTIERP
jgi:hypothetical protein